MRMTPLVLISALLFVAARDLEAAGDDKAATPVRAVQVQQESVNHPVEALGTLLAQESVTLTATVTETVTAIHFEDGDRVSAGQVLVEMTSTQEHALLEEARSTVEEARSQYQRVASLAEVGNAAASLLDQRKREWETAQARLVAIQSQLDDRLITAPFAGVVGFRNLSPGALVQPGTMITTLDDDRVMKLEFALPATLLGLVQAGLTVTTTSSAFPGREFTGTVSAVDSRIDPIARSLTVRALVPNPDGLLKPGLLMKVRLLSDPREALLIPEESLLPLGAQQFVFVMDEGTHTVSQREINIGQRFFGQVEVLAGLSLGEWVVTHGADRLQEGQQVAPQAAFAASGGQLP